MSKRWINCDPKFIPFVAQVLDLAPTPTATIVAEFQGNVPLCAVIFDGYNGQSIHAHIWIAPGRKPSRSWWFAIYHYMFEQCAVKNVIGTVPASNEAARRLDEHLGFELKCVIPAYYPNGDAMMLYVCTPETALDWRRFQPKTLPTVSYA